MQHLKGIVFDIDGTLLDTSEFIYQAFEHTLKAFGFEVPTRDILIQKTGKLLEVDYRTLTGVIDPTALCEAHRVFQRDHQHLVHSFPNTKETLQVLKKKGLWIAAASTRSKITCGESLKQGGIFEELDLLLSAEDVQKQKPDPESILKCLAHFNTLPSEAIMVGDRDSDIQAGKSAGTKTVGVTYGYSGNKIVESEPDFVIHDISELLKTV